MLEELRIRGLGVIDDACLELSAGLTVLTGETGAGKTMVLSAVNLLLGGRADAGLVRHGASRADVEGRIRLAPDSAAARRALEAGADLELGADLETGALAELPSACLVLARTVSAEGRSRAFLGGRSVPAPTLAGTVEELIAVHGQHDQQRLGRGAEQRAILDRFAADTVAPLLVAWRDRYRRLREVESALVDITTRSRERAQEADLLRFGLAEVEALAPRPGEAEELATRAARLGHADQLHSAVEAAHEILVGADSAAGSDAVAVLDYLGQARRALEGGARLDPELAELAERLHELTAAVNDVASDLGRYGDGIDADPALLEQVHKRRAALNGLTRKYGPSLDDVLSWAEGAAARLLELDGDDGQLEQLRQASTCLRAELAALASQLTVARSRAGDQLSELVGVELAALAMPSAALRVAVTRAAAASVGVGSTGLLVEGVAVECGPSGTDQVELLLSPHAGSGFRPLARTSAGGASGGELSRVMLALQVVLAGSDPVGTFVFDEVDAGVGGAAAVEVGRRLARLARHGAQVLVVTHLPQVAAFADQHLQVSRSGAGTVTTSDVVTLDRAGRIAELARMLAGLGDSSTARAHAEELLDLASPESLPSGSAAAEPVQAPARPGRRSRSRVGTTRRPT